MKVLFGVPTLNRYDLLGKLLASVDAGTRKPDHYLIVDNGRQLDAKLADGTLMIPPGNYAMERPETNLGVAGSWNVILRHAEALNATAIISGDDIEVATDTLERLIAYAEQSPRLFFCVNGASSFAFFLQKPELAQKIGYYDELFWPGYFEDNDYHRRMQLAGENYEIVEGVTVSHLVSGTLKGYGESKEKRWIEKEFDKNSRYYGIKWGGPPGHERLGAPDPAAAGHRGGRETP